MGVRVPRAYEEAIVDLIKPDFPNVMEAKFIGPNPNHAPAVENDNAEGYDIEHCLGGEVKMALSPPEGVDADGLRNNPDNEEVGEHEGVIRYNGVLERADYGYRGVEGVAQEEVANKIKK